VPKLRVKKGHMQVISGILRAFSQVRVRVPTGFTQKAIRHSCDVHLREFVLTPQLSR
jgi:hypothetical protein